MFMRGDHAQPRLIHDTVKPTHDDELLKIPAGFAGYQPFEELGKRIKKRRALPFLRRKRITVTTNNRVHAVIVSREDSTPLKFTRIPPMSSQVMERAYEMPSLLTETSDVLQDSLNKTGRKAFSALNAFAQRMAAWLSRGASSPLLWVTTLRNWIYARHYMAQTGTHNILTHRLTKHSKLWGAGFLALLAIMAVAALMLPIMLNEEHRGGKGSTVGGSQSAANANSGSSASASHPKSPSGSVGTPAASSTAPFTTSPVVGSGNPITSQINGGTPAIPVIGGMGGGENLPSGTSPAMPASPIPLPYTVTVPGQSVQLDDKQVVGTTPIGITLN